MGLFDNVHILGLFGLIAIYGHVCQQYIIKKSLLRLLFAKLFWGYLMHISKTALMEIEGV